jgi:hypothetical protein
MTQAVWKRPEILVLVLPPWANLLWNPGAWGFDGVAMHRFIDGEDRMPQTLPPNSLEDYVSQENPVRVIEVLIDELDRASLGFSGMTPAATGRPI